MSSRTATVSNIFAIVVAAVVWPALVLQYWLMMWSGPLGAVTLRYVSFFTILSNLLVALVATSAATGGNAAVLRLWRGARVRGLAALSISVTFLIYTTLLQGLWHPMGPQLLADRLLHDVVPFLYVLWWMALQPHGGLAWSDALRWLVFPGVFLVWTLLRGAVVGEYPYPFLDVTRHGYGAVLLGSLGIGVLFLALGLLYVAVDRMLSRDR